MSEFIQGAAIVVFYRTFTIACGFGIIYLGYKLFRIGVYEKAGELKAAWGDRHLTLKQAAPGTVFALFGALVLGIAIWRGVDLESMQKRDSSSPLAQQPAEHQSKLRSPQKAAEQAIRLPNAALPSDVKLSLRKITESKPLSEAERTTLLSWLTKNLVTQEESRIHFQARQPKEEIQHQLERFGIPVERPG
jgi:hypothetical protein